MYVMHIALGGCLSTGPIRYGITEDTGGHIAYVLGATEAQAARPDVARVSIVTRAFDDARLGARFASTHERFGPKRDLIRLRSARPEYLEKDDLAGELPSLTRAFLDHLTDAVRPDVIHAHFADAAVLARAASQTFGIPWVFSAHSLGRGKDATGAAHDARIARETTAIAEAGAIVASSRDEAERQLLSYEIDATGITHRIEPGIHLPTDENPDACRRLLGPWLRDPGKPIVLAIARPVAKKNLGAVIEAYGQDRRLRDRANLVIVAGLRAGLAAGDGVMLDLFDRIDRLDLWGRVALPRHHLPGDIPALYRRAAAGGVFVNPAFEEPFGLTVVEAVRFGVPVVATRNGGPADILSAVGHGRTIDPDSPTAIAAACLDLMTDPDRAIHTAEAARAAERIFCWDNWARTTTTLYRTLRRRQPAIARPHRLLVSDMDGTLTGDRGDARRLAARLDAPDAPMLVVATGRPLTEARRVLARWSLPEPACLIAAVGSEIWWRCDGGRYRLDRLYAGRIGRDWDATAIRAVAAELGLREQAPYEQRPWKLGFAGTASGAAALRERLGAAGLSAHVIASHGRFIDVLPARAGKAAAARHVASYLDLGSSDCMAAGDSGNDRDLLEWAGRAVIPANALAEIADIAGRSILRSRHRHAGAILDALGRWDVPSAPASSAVAAE